MTHVATVCRACPAGQNGLKNALTQALHHLPIAVSDTDCMSGCARASTVAFRAPGKTAYLFGDLTAQDLPNLVTFAEAYIASPDGTFADARPLGTLRTKALARIPGATE